MIIRLNKKNFNDEELPQEFHLTTRQITKRRNAFANDMSSEVKLRQAQISKTIQSGGSFSSWLAKFRKKH